MENNKIPNFTRLYGAETKTYCPHCGKPVDKKELIKITFGYTSIEAMAEARWKEYEEDAKNQHKGKE